MSVAVAAFCLFRIHIFCGVKFLAFGGHAAIKLCGVEQGHGAYAAFAC